ncbi:MAG: hypothetical protein HRT36_07065 [Alphaproteobacteria bacterium]|nr:hypothetical protein [Alphaproteobacteria bacterium]
MGVSRLAMLLVTVLGLLLSGCGQLQDISLLGIGSEESLVKIRQEIFLSPSVYGVVSHLEKKKIIQANKTVQEKKVMPLVQVLRQKSEPEIRELLGAPQRMLREGQILIWQYVTEVCQWDMYFQENPGKRNMALYDLIIHQRGQILISEVEIQRCENSLLQQRLSYD